MLQKCVFQGWPKDQADLDPATCVSVREPDRSKDQVDLGPTTLDMFKELGNTNMASLMMLHKTFSFS